MCVWGVGGVQGDESTSIKAKTNFNLVGYLHYVIGILF